jgi:hypothetical protein
MMSALVITYARTENLFNGEPWPPDGFDYWAIVKRDRSHTIWRRIAAATNKTSIRRRRRRTEATKRAAETKTMVSMRQYAGSHFWKVDDVRDGPTRLTIEAVVDGKYNKPDIIFHDGSRLSANVTNVRALIRAYGDDSADWKDKEVDLVLGEVDFEDKKQEAVIVKPFTPPVKPKPKKAEARANGADDDMDDQIPF